MSDTIRARAGQALDLVARARARAGARKGAGATHKELQQVRRRLAVLEEDSRECRRLHRRLAELTDVVEELLLPVAERDEAALAEMLERYRAGL